MDLVRLRDCFQRKPTPDSFDHSEADIMNKSGQKPTAAELRILQILWDEGPTTVRAVHRRISEESDLSYTTILKMLQIMHGKGLVSCDKSQRAHVYQPTEEREATQRHLLKDFLSRVYQGSATRMVMQALGDAEPANPEELKALRKYLDTIETGDS